MKYRFPYPHLDVEYLTQAGCEGCSQRLTQAIKVADGGLDVVSDPPLRLPHSSPGLALAAAMPIDQGYAVSILPGYAPVAVARYIFARRLPAPFDQPSNLGMADLWSAQEDLSLGDARLAFILDRGLRTAKQAGNG